MRSAGVRADPDIICNARGLLDEMVLRTHVRSDDAMLTEGCGTEVKDLVISGTEILRIVLAFRMP